MFQNLLRPPLLGFQVRTYVIFSQPGDECPVIFCLLWPNLHFMHTVCIHVCFMRFTELFKALINDKPSRTVFKIRYIDSLWKLYFLRVMELGLKIVGFFMKLRLNFILWWGARCDLVWCGVGFGFVVARSRLLAEFIFQFQIPLAPTSNESSELTKKKYNFQFLGTIKRCKTKQFSVREKSPQLARFRDPNNKGLTANCSRSHHKVLRDK